LLNVPPKNECFLLMTTSILFVGPGVRLTKFNRPFVPRHLYGEYLADVLSEAENKAIDRRTLLRIHDEVTEVDLLPKDRGAWLRLRNRKPVRADRLCWLLAINLLLIPQG